MNNVVCFLMFGVMMTVCSAQPPGGGHPTPSPVETECATAITNMAECKVIVGSNEKMRGECEFGMDGKLEWHCRLDGEHHKNESSHEGPPAMTQPEKDCAEAIGKQAECKVTAGNGQGGCRYGGKDKNWHCCLAGECPPPHKGDKGKGESDEE